MCFWLLCQTVWFLVFLIITSFQSSSVFIFFSTLYQMPSLSLVYITNHHVILITLLHPADLWQSARNPYSAVTDVQVVRFTSCWCFLVELKGLYEPVGRPLMCPQTGLWTKCQWRVCCHKLNRYVGCRWKTKLAHPRVGTLANTNDSSTPTQKCVASPNLRLDGWLLPKSGKKML